MEPGEIEDISPMSIHKEESMEEDTYLQNKYKEIKKWYNSQQELKEKYGKFPMFWQELRDWESWKDVDSLYSRFLQQSLEKKDRSEKRNRWADASSLLKRSRWDQERRFVQPGLNVAITSGLISIEQVQEIILRVRVRDLSERIENAEKEADEISKDPNRSPSPPPLYDSAGNRTNTRAMRIRRSLDTVRSELIDEILLLNPTLRTKHHCKYQKKIYIPQDQYPEYNFVGQIMGPRGKSHRNLERQTHTKILVRGRGSSRDGKESIDNMGRDEPLHVIITGDDEEGVKAAEEVIREICTVKDDKVNEYKKAQMRELAIINGQLFEGIICSVCGERGHNQYQCPNRPKNYKQADVLCAICGETSHLTKDCPQRHDKKKIAEMKQRDDAYLEFLEELEGKKEDKDKGSQSPMVEEEMDPYSNQIHQLGVSQEVPLSSSMPMGFTGNVSYPTGVTANPSNSFSGVSGGIGYPTGVSAHLPNSMPGVPGGVPGGIPYPTGMTSNLGNSIPNAPGRMPSLSSVPNTYTPAQPTPVIRPGVISYAPQNQSWQQQNFMNNMQAMFSFMMQSGMIPQPPNSNTK